MSTGFRGCLILLGLVILVPSGRADEASDADLKRQLVASIDEAIERLEKKDVRAFLEHHAPIDVLRQLREAKRTALVARDVAKSPAFLKRMTKFLERAKAGTFAFRAEGYEAHVRLPAPDDGDEEGQPPPLEPLPELEITGYEGDLEAVFKAATADLTAKKYATFLKKTMPVGELRELTRRKDGLAELVARVNAQPAMATAMTNDLTALAKMEPEFVSEGTVAVFRREAVERTSGRIKYTIPAREVRWEKVDGHWRFQGPPDEFRKRLRELRLTAGRGLEGETVVFERFGSEWRLLAFPE